MRFQKAQAIVEFAFVLPLLLVFIVGIIYFGFAFADYLMLSNTTNISVLILRIFDAVHELSKAMEFDSMEQKYSIPSRLGAIAGVVMHWINNGQKETPEEIVDYLMSFILTI